VEEMAFECVGNKRGMMPVFKKSIQVIDTHTAGEPTRILFGRLPFIPGSTMEEKYRQDPTVLGKLDISY
jgi:hypothetical protein